MAIDGHTCRHVRHYEDCKVGTKRQQVPTRLIPAPPVLAGTRLKFIEFPPTPKSSQTEASGGALTSSSIFKGHSNYDAKHSFQRSWYRHSSVCSSPQADAQGGTPPSWLHAGGQSVTLSLNPRSLGAFLGKAFGQRRSPCAFMLRRAWRRQCRLGPVLCRDCVNLEWGC